MDLSKMFNPGSKAIAPSSEPVATAPVAGSTAVPILSAEAFAKEALRRGFTLTPVVQPAAAEPAVESAEERRLRVESYEHTDLPPRSPQEISLLLRFESEADVQARIRNDQARFINRRQSREVNPNSAIIDGNASHSGSEGWVRR